MYSGNCNISGFKIVFKDQSTIVSAEEHNKYIISFMENLNSAISKYPNLDIKSYFNDMLLLLGHDQMFFKSKLSSGNFIEIKIDLDKEKYANDKSIQNAFSNFKVWGSDSKKRKIMDEIFSGSVENLYEVIFNESIRSFNDKNSNFQSQEPLFEMKEDVNLTHPDQFLKFPREIVLMVLDFYKNFMEILLNKEFSEMLSGLSETDKNSERNYYKILKFLKETYLPHKDNQTMKEIFIMLPNGSQFLMIIERICESNLFKDFENTEITQLMK